MNMQDYVSNRKKIFRKSQKRMDNFSDTTENEIDENDAEIQKLLK